MGTVLIVLGLVVASLLGFLIAIGVVPLGEYFGADRKKERERRAREYIGRSTTRQEQPRAGKPIT